MSRVTAPMPKGRKAANRKSDLRNARRRHVAAKSPITWRSQAQFFGVVLRPDRALALIVQPTQDGRRWSAAALETVPPEGATVADALDDHAHKMIGAYDDVREAFKACETFGRAWQRKHKSTRADKCECDEIGGRRVQT